MKRKMIIIFILYFLSLAMMSICIINTVGQAQRDKYRGYVKEASDINRVGIFYYQNVTIEYWAPSSDSGIISYDVLAINKRIRFLLKNSGYDSFDFIDVYVSKNNKTDACIQTDFLSKNGAYSIILCSLVLFILTVMLYFKWFKGNET